MHWLYWWMSERDILWWIAYWISWWNSNDFQIRVQLYWFSLSLNLWLCIERRNIIRLFSWHFLYTKCEVLRMLAIKFPDHVLSFDAKRQRLILNLCHEETVVLRRIICLIWFFIILTIPSPRSNLLHFVRDYAMCFYLEVVKQNVKRENGHRMFYC